MDSIFDYEHPFLTVDGVIFRIKDEALQVLLMHRNDEHGEWALPGGFVPVDRLAEEALNWTVWEKTGVKGFYEEQLKTYDGLDRDPRARVISMAYIGILYDEEENLGQWFTISPDWTHLKRKCLELPFSALAFDHELMLKDALERIRGKLWWSDLPMYFLPEEFILKDLELVFSLFSGRKPMNFRRQMDGRIEPLNKTISTGGRPAQMFRWVKKGWEKSC